MAVVFDGTNDALTYASPFDYNAPYTFSAWVRPNAASAGQGIFCVHYNAGTLWHNMDDMYFTASPNWNTRAFIGGVTNGDGNDKPSWVNGTYYHVAVVRSSPTSLSLVLNGRTIGTDTTDVTGRTAANRLVLGNGWNAGSLYMRGQIAHAKFWTAALSIAEILSEAKAAMPVRWTNLWAWYPMRPGTTERARDYSGNGRNLTEAGSLTDSIDPGISWSGTPILVVPFLPSGPQTFPQTVTGSITPNGAPIRKTAKTPTGSLTPSGVVLKRPGKLPAGALTPLGTLTTLKVALRMFTGALTPAGTLTARTGKTITGALAPTGALVRRTSKGIAGALTPAGALLKQAAKTFTGALTPAGALAVLKAILRTFTGALDPAGALVRQTNKSLAGTLTPAGTWLARIGKTLAGALTPTGALATVKAILRTFTGAIAPTGIVLRSTNITFGGILVPAGVIAKRIATTLTGALSAAGTLVAQIVGGGTGSLRLTVTLGDSALTVCTLSDAAATHCTLSDSALTTLTLKDSPYD